MANTLMVFNTAKPGSVVRVPYIPDEPIYFVLERISALLGEDPTKVSGRKLFVDGIPLDDLSQSVDRHRILGNGFSYSCHPTGKFSVFVKTLIGKSLFIHCRPDDTIEHIMQKTRDKHGMPTDEPQLIYVGKVLEHHRTLRDYQIQKDSTLGLGLRLRGGRISAGFEFADVSDSSPLLSRPFVKNAPPGRLACKGTNIECRCQCSIHLVICQRRLGITEMATTEFECPLSGSKDVTPVTAGFSKCKFRVHGIKTSGEQHSSKWTAVLLKDGYTVYGYRKQESWGWLMIESVALDRANGGLCLMCLRKTDEPQLLECGHHYHSKCFTRWDRCPACTYNQHVKLDSR